MPDNIPDQTPATETKKNETPTQADKNRKMGTMIASVIIAVLLLGGIVTWAIKKQADDQKRHDDQTASDQKKKDDKAKADKDEHDHQMMEKQTMMSALTKIDTLNFTLSPVGTDGLSGLATIKQNSDNIKVSLNLPGPGISRSSAPLPSYIYKGTCDKPGSVLMPLTNVFLGKSETTTVLLTLSQIQDQLPLLIMVHKSETEYLSCANLSLDPTGYQNMQGTFKGTNASLLTGSLVFPNSSLTINPDSTFKFTASDLDLALLGQEKLKVNNVYPKVYATTNGIVSTNSDGKTFDFIVTSLDTDFKANGTSLDAAAKSSILEALSQSKIVLPTITQDKPVTVNANVILNGNTIQITNTNKSSIVLNFNGTKS